MTSDKHQQWNLAYWILAILLLMMVVRQDGQAPGKPPAAVPEAMDTA